MFVGVVLLLLLNSSACAGVPVGVRGEAPPRKENLKNAKKCVQSQKEVKNENWEALREEKEEWKYYYTSFHIHLIGYIDHMEPPEADEKFGYKVIMEDGHVVDFLHKSKRRKHLRRAVRYFLSHTGYLFRMSRRDGFSSMVRDMFK